MPEPVIACTLSPLEQLHRRDHVTNLRERALVEAKSLPTGLRLRFSAHPGIGEELERLIDAESECCSFLSFDLDRREGELVLEVTGPDQAQPVIRELFGLGRK